MPYYSINNKPTHLIINCDECISTINEKQGFFQCDTCKKNFHSHCKGIYGKNITRMAALHAWYCSAECSITIADQSTVSDDQQATDPNLNQLEYSEKPENLKEYVNKKFEMLHQLIVDSNKVLVKNISEIHHSQEFLCAQFDDLSEKFDRIAVENKNLKDKIKCLEAKQSEYEYTVNNLYEKLDSTEQHKISQNLIIAGIPRTEENPNNVIKTIFEKLEVNPEIINEIESINYINNSTKSNTVQNTKLIKVKFATLSSKEHVINKKASKKSLTVREINLRIEDDTNVNDNQIFFRDELTAFQLQLYRESKSIKDNHHFKYLWVKNQRIFLRQTDSSKIYNIKSKNDLIMIGKTLARLSNSSEIQHNSSILTSY